MLSIVTNYKMLLSSISELIDVSGYKNEYLAKKLEMRPANFSAKKQRASWTPDEVEKILTYAMNEDVEDYLLLKEMESREGEETMTYAELKKEMGWK